jgi:CheY-like chemotaxis protein
MSARGPIVLIEDDPDDIAIFEEVLKQVEPGRELKWFENATDGFNYLKETEKPTFLILCDINLPGMNGLDFKKKIDADRELRKKSIPFIFLSTVASQELVEKAYFEMTVQGFFRKPHSYEEMGKIVRHIIDYWSSCRHPNSAA